MTTTVHLDRHGYVVEVFQGTRISQLDERKYAGRLMEVAGPVAPGMRWDGQRFAQPPPRIEPDAIAAERARRIETYFPERLRAQVTAFGGENAMRVQRYLAEVHAVAERMMLDGAPQDYAEDHHWPSPPVLADLPMPVPHHETSPAPINLTVAPVIHAERAAEPTVIEHHTVSERLPTVSQGEFGLDARDPLYALKVALVRTIADTVARHGPGIPDPDRDIWEGQLADMAAMATAARSADEIAQQEARIAAFIGGVAV